MDIITRKRYDPKDSKPVSLFIAEFETLVEQYNEQGSEPGMVLTGPMMKSLLQTSLSGVSMLRGVSDRESDRIVQGGSSFTYEEYLWAVKSSAALYDEQKIGRRSVNMTSWEPLTGNRQGLDELEVYMANQTRRLPGASMNKETWQAISNEGKVTWDKLNEADKKQILQYATQRAATKPSIEVKSHSLDNAIPPDKPAADNDAQRSMEVMTVSPYS